MSHLPQLLFILFLLVASAFFAAAETALFSLTAIQRRRLKVQHLRISPVIDRLLDQPRRTLVSLLIGNNLVHILASAIVSLTALNLWGEGIVPWVIAGFTVVLIVFGEIIPKTVAVRNNELISAFTALPLHAAAKILKPLRWLVRSVTDRILAILIREPRKPSDMISEKELQALIQIVQEEGVLDPDEGKRLGRLFEFEERSVKEIMTPRTELVAYDVNEPAEELANLVKTYHYTHMPVYRDTLDHMLGVVATQEFMLNPEKTIQDLVKSPLYVPETQRIDDLLSEMKKTRIHFAICVDEYGGTAGLVTLEDILEEIFGEIYDEYSKKEVLITKIGRDEYLADGRLPLNRFNDFFGADLASQESETLSGFILEILGHIPKLKETVKFQNFIFEIREVERQRIAKIFIRRGGV